MDVPETPAFLPLPAKTRTAAVCEALRADILEARAVPGSRLHLGRLADRFGVSPGAVREALSRLVADGWVRAIDQRGFRVAEVSVADLMDITRARIDIESIALRRSIEAGDAAWEARVLAAAHELSRATPQRVEALQGTMVPWGALHRRFHDALVSACGSDWIMRFRVALTEQSERYRKLSVALPTQPRDVDREHQEIVEAALDRDAAAAIAFMAGHFQRTADVVLASSTWADQGSEEAA